ncbi:33215_t:CDS:2, partial [Racocetra persica]
SNLMANIENNQPHDIKNDPSLEYDKNDPSLEYDKNDPSLEYDKNDPSLEYDKNDPSLEYGKSDPSLEYIKSEKSDQACETENTTPIAVFMFFIGIAPLGWASYSDVRETRRRVYLMSLTIYVIAGIICAVSNNIWLLLVMRSFQACGGSSVQSIGAGTVSDVFINT